VRNFQIVIVLQSKRVNDVCKLLQLLGEEVSQIHRCQSIGVHSVQTPICGHPRICLYCVKCTKFGQFISMKIIKIVATRFQILRPKCTKFDFGWSSAPDPAGGAYSAAPGHVLYLRSLLLRGGRKREGEGKGRGGEGREGKENERKRKGRKEKGEEKGEEEWEGREEKGRRKSWKVT